MYNSLSEYCDLLDMHAAMAAHTCMCAFQATCESDLPFHYTISDCHVR